MRWTILALIIIWGLMIFAAMKTCEYMEGPCNQQVVTKTVNGQEIMTYECVKEEVQ